MRLLIIALFLAGCASTPPTPPVTPQQVSPVIIHPTLPIPVTLEVPKFYVLTPDNVQEFFTREKTPVVYAVDTSGYQVLAANVQELRRYILELQNVVKYYKTSIEAQKKQNDVTTR